MIGVILGCFYMKNVFSMGLKQLQQPLEILDFEIPLTHVKHPEPTLKGKFDFQDLREISVVGGSDPEGPDDTGNVSHIKCETCPPTRKVCLAWTRIVAFRIKICKKYGYPRRRRPQPFQIPIIEDSSISGNTTLLIGEEDQDEEQHQDRLLSIKVL